MSTSSTNQQGGNDHADEKAASKDVRGKNVRVTKRKAEFACFVLGVITAITGLIGSNLLSYHKTEPGVEFLTVAVISAALGVYMFAKHVYALKRVVNRYPFIWCALGAFVLIVRATYASFFAPPQQQDELATLIKRQQTADIVHLRTTLNGAPEVGRPFEENSLTAGIHFINRGGPAKNVDIDSDAQFINSDTGLPREQLVLFCKGSTHGDQVAPEEQFGTVFTILMHDEDVRDWHMGKYDLVISGSVTYEDIFGNRHEPALSCERFTYFGNSLLQIRCGAPQPRQQNPRPVPVPGHNELAKTTPKETPESR